MKIHKIIRMALLVLIPCALAAGFLIASVAARQQPGQQTPQKSVGNPQTPAKQNQDMPGMDMGDMDMDGMEMSNGGKGAGQAGSGADSGAEQGAMSAMSNMHHHQMGPHMYMTAKRPASAADWTKADEIAEQLRGAIEKYKDYHVALAEGFRIFMPNLPQAEYHFTSYQNAFVESFTFDPTRPTSLLYRKTQTGREKTGWELIGAMYTMPKRVSEAQLNERIPLGVAQWHLHTNLCVPPKGRLAHADLTKFGLDGSISTKQACTEAGGTFYPVIFGWMVHVYPFGHTREEVWGQ